MLFICLSTAWAYDWYDHYQGNEQFDIIHNELMKGNIHYGAKK